MPDSGATSHMFTHKSDFGDDYKRCKDVFVFMGDNTQVLEHGYGTVRIKLNGKVQVLPKSLHIPDLDCSLLSITRHGRKKGYTFFSGNGMMHLTFPNFSINASLPKNGDLRLNMEELTGEDWLSSDFTYGTDSVEELDHLDVFALK